MYENTGTDDKMSRDQTGFLHENAPIARSSATIARAYWLKIRRSRDNWLRSWEWQERLARVTAWPGWPCHKDWTPAFVASTEQDRVPSDASVKASRDVSETKGVTRRMARISSQSMLLKLKLLSDFYVVRVTAKNPPENRRAKPECC